MRKALSLAMVGFWSLMAHGQETSQETAEPMKEAEFSITVQVDLKHKYWIYLPADYDRQDNWPLLIFLHGAGERGDNLEQVKTHGPPKLIAAGQAFPMVVISPQCPRNGSWHPDAVAGLTREIAANYKIDPTRIYLTGLSMGGFGTWATGAKYPDLYAALVPICGGGDPAQAAKLKDQPIWAFHGAKDAVVPLRRSEEMVNAIRAAGGNPQLTVYPDADHDSWTAAYNDPALLEWLLKQHR